MAGEYTRLELLRGASVGAVGVMTLVLLALLPAPGFRTSRLVLFGVIIALGWIGGAGALWVRFWPTTLGAAGLFLLGFWQFTIGLVMLPTSFVLLLTAIVMRNPPGEPTTVTP